MFSFAFILAFSLMLGVIAIEAISPGELEASLFLGEEVTVDVVCTWGPESNQKQVLVDGNNKVVKVTGSKASFNCKGGTTIEALGIPEEKHEELEIACISQYQHALRVLPMAQPALNSAGAPFLSKSTRLDRICKFGGIYAKVLDCQQYGRSARPMLSVFYTSGGVKLESFPENC